MYRNYRELTEAELSELEKLYPVTPNRELVRRFGISLDALARILAKSRGWKKDRKAVLVGNRGGRTLTEKEIKWFIKHFKHTRNADIMAKFGIGESQLHRTARKYGLKKSPQFIRKMMTEVTMYAYDVCRKHGIYEETRERMRRKMRELYERGERIPGSFRPGQSNKDRLSPERYRECKEKMTATMNEIRRKERMRIHWGLPQKTKLRLSYNGYTPEARKRSVHRHLFRKYNYIVEHGANTVYYDEFTERRLQMEKNASKYGLTVEPLEEEDYGQEDYEHIQSGVTL